MHSKQWYSLVTSCSLKFIFIQIRRAYDHHLLNFLIKYVRRYPAPLNEYLKYDDNLIFSLMRSHSRDADARRILSRDPFVQAFTTQEHIDEEQRTKIQLVTRDVGKNV